MGPLISVGEGGVLRPDRALYLQKKKKSLLDGQLLGACQRTQLSV